MALKQQTTRNAGTAATFSDALARGDEDPSKIPMGYSIDLNSDSSDASDISEPTMSEERAKAKAKEASRKYNDEYYAYRNRVEGSTHNLKEEDEYLDGIERTKSGDNGIKSTNNKSASRSNKTQSKIDGKTGSSATRRDSMENGTVRRAVSKSRIALRSPLKRRGSNNGQHMVTAKPHDKPETVNVVKKPSRYKSPFSTRSKGAEGRSNAGMNKPTSSAQGSRQAQRPQHGPPTQQDQRPEQAQRSQQAQCPQQVQRPQQTQRPQQAQRPHPAQTQVQLEPQDRPKISPLHRHPNSVSEHESNLQHHAPVTHSIASQSQSSRQSSSSHVTPEGGQSAVQVSTNNTRNAKEMAVHSPSAVRKPSPLQVRPDAQTAVSQSRPQHTPSRQTPSFHTKFNSQLPTSRVNSNEQQHSLKVRPSNQPTQPQSSAARPNGQASSPRARQNLTTLSPNAYSHTKHTQSPRAPQTNQVRSVGATKPRGTDFAPSTSVSGSCQRSIASYASDKKSQASALSSVVSANHSQRGAAVSGVRPSRHTHQRAHVGEASSQTSALSSVASANYSQRGATVSGARPDSHTHPRAHVRETSSQASALSSVASANHSQRGAAVSGARPDNHTHSRAHVGEAIQQKRAFMPSIFPEPHINNTNHPAKQPQSRLQPVANPQKNLVEFPPPDVPVQVDIVVEEHSDVDNGENSNSDAQPVSIFSFLSSSRQIWMREQEMKSIARAANIPQSRWNGSLLFNQWKGNSPTQRTPNPQSDPVKISVTPPSHVVVSWNQQFIHTLSSFYASGVVNIPQTTNGKDVLMLLEYFGVVYSPDKLVFDSMGAYVKIKMWSDYMSRRAAMAQYVIHKCMSRTKLLQVFVTTPDASEIETNTLYYVGGKLCDVFDGNLAIQSGAEGQSTSCASEFNPI
jgi:hypothetical protein